MYAKLFILGEGCGYEALNVSDILFVNSGDLHLPILHL